MPEWIRTVMEALLGGSLVVTLLTLRATRRKATAEAASVERDNRSKDMDLSERYVNAFNKNIVEPLKEEMELLKRQVSELRGEVKELKDAVQKANTCRHADDCPVLRRLQKHQGDLARGGQHVGGTRIRNDPGGGERRERGGDDVERHDDDDKPGGRHDDDCQQRTPDDAEEGQGQRQ